MTTYRLSNRQFALLRQLQDGTLKAEDVAATKSISMTTLRSLLLRGAVTFNRQGGLYVQAQAINILEAFFRGEAPLRKDPTMDLSHTVQAFLDRNLRAKTTANAKGQSVEVVKRPGRKAAA